MPYKLRDSRRHKFKKARFKITNWSQYNNALIQRGSITLWFSKEVIKAWHPSKIKKRERGGQFKYSDLVIETALTLKALFSLPYRGTQGLLKSIIQLMGVYLKVPDYSRICRRAKTLLIPDLKSGQMGEPIHLLIDSTGLKIFGQGQWSQEKHGLTQRREWRKLHVAIDRDTHEIVAQELTTSDTSDESQMKALLSEIEGNITFVSADGAYDSDSVYQVISAHSSEEVVVAIPPRKHAALSADYQTLPNKRDHNILFSEEQGHYRWQAYSGYHDRALAETTRVHHRKVLY